MVYADANATYPVPEGHYRQVFEMLEAVDGNPSSVHSRGREAKVALENARTTVAGLFGAEARDVSFTSGATEANNLAIQGVIRKHAGSGPHVIVTATEHSSVLEPADLLAERGECRVTRVPVGTDGRVDPQVLLDAIEENTVLVCVMHANNEVGAVNPVEEVAAEVKAKAAAVHVHVDAVQTFGKLDLTGYAQSSIDSAAASAHKVGGLKGTGALYLKRGCKLSPLLAGGGQERSRRPGTENMAGIVSLGLRAQALADAGDWLADARCQRDRLREALEALPGVVIHGRPEAGLPNTLNFHVEGVTGDDVLLNFDLAGIQASSGSACSSGVGRPSHVLQAMGYGDWEALNSIRLSLHDETRAADVDHIVATLKDVVKRVRG